MEAETHLEMVGMPRHTRRRCPPRMLTRLILQPRSTITQGTSISMRLTIGSCSNILVGCGYQQPADCGCGDTTGKSLRLIGIVSSLFRKNIVLPFFGNI